MIDFDFIPDHFHQRRQLKQATKTRGYCVGSLVCMMVLWAVAHHHRLSEAEAMLREVSMQDEQITINIAKKEVMEQQREMLRDRQRLIEQLRSRTTLVVVLSDLSRCLPETIVLTELEVIAPSVSEYAVSEGPEIDASTMRGSDRGESKGHPFMAQPKYSGRPRISMTGIATESPEVIKYAAELERSPLFDRVQVDVVGAVEWGTHDAQKFELTCDLVQQRGATQ